MAVVPVSVSGISFESEPQPTRTRAHSVTVNGRSIYSSCFGARRTFAPQRRSNPRLRHGRAYTVTMVCAQRWLWCHGFGRFGFCYKELIQPDGTVPDEKAPARRGSFARPHGPRHGARPER